MAPIRSIKPRLDALLLLALAGCGAVLAASLALDLPQKIATGNRGRAAIRALDAMRRPFLAMKREETELLRPSRDDAAEASLLKATGFARRQLAAYRELARYNPKLSRRVDALSDAFEEWAASDHRMLEEFHADGTGVAAGRYLPIWASVASGFLETMNRLGDGEEPIHTDIERGQLANELLLGMLSGLLLFFLCLAFAQQRRKSGREKELLRERIALERDATEAVEKALSEAEQERARFEAIVAAIDSGIIVQDREFRVLYQNDRHRRLLGDHMGERCFRAYGNEEGVCEDCPAEEAYQQRRVRRVEKSATINGSTLHLEITASPIFDAQGQVVASLESIRDITERKHAEAALQSAKDRAEDANRAKDRLLANVTHELRTPLNAILGYTELVLDGIDGPINDQQARSLRNAEKNGRELLRMIDQMLDLSKLEAEDHLPAWSRFGLREVIADVEDTLKVLAARKRLLLSSLVTPDVPDALLGDPDRLRQILLNLGNNAIKFTDQGKVTVDVRHEEAQSEELRLHFRVRDTGGGIAPEHWEKIFDPFFQTDNSSTRLHGGAGLGLTICAQLARRMGGRIWVRSEVGKGSTFHFTARFLLQRQDHRQLELPELLSS